jgi:hypothetical protein
MCWSGVRDWSREREAKRMVREREMNIFKTWDQRRKRDRYKQEA